jgi:hypothetical protein
VHFYFQLQRNYPLVFKHTQAGEIPGRIDASEAADIILDRLQSMGLTFTRDVTSWYDVHTELCKGERMLEDKNGIKRN